MADAPDGPAVSSLRLQAADVLRRARRLPVGPHRNDLRQLAIGLRWLDKNGFEKNRFQPFNAVAVPENGEQGKLP